MKNKIFYFIGGLIITVSLIGHFNKEIYIFPTLFILGAFILGFLSGRESLK